VDRDACGLEPRCSWRQVKARIAEIEAALPFAILDFDCDNGGEFLNWHLVDYFGKRPRSVPFTRSPPYHKNDNARVEQKQVSESVPWLAPLNGSTKPCNVWHPFSA
jgi:hypothetical protein